jgi:hypothetical protein
MKTVLYWTDQEDHDNAANRGTEFFDSNAEMMTRLNELNADRPKLEFSAFEKCRELKVERIEVVTKLWLS